MATSLSVYRPTKFLPFCWVPRREGRRDRRGYRDREINHFMDKSGDILRIEYKTSLLLYKSL